MAWAKRVPSACAKTSFRKYEPTEKLQEAGVVGSELKGSSDESLRERSREAFAFKSPFYDDHKGEFCMIDPGINEISQ